MFDVLVVLVGDDVFPVGVLRHGGDDVAVGQIAQVRELLAERLGLGFQGFDPVFVAVDPKSLQPQKTTAANSMMIFSIFFIVVPFFWITAF